MKGAIASTLGVTVASSDGSELGNCPFRAEERKKLDIVVSHITAIIALLQSCVN